MSGDGQNAGTSQPEGESRNPPPCPTCSKQMVFCEPSHEKPYWTCPNIHDPIGVVQMPREVGYSFATAMVQVRDVFDTVGVDPFADLETADDVPGLVTDLMLDRYQHCVEFKRMRQRKAHDDTPDRKPSCDDGSEQTTLKAIADGGSRE